jgi:hypothetical protein
LPTAHRRSLVIIALFGFWTPAGAQEACPELTRLHAEADAALEKATGLAGPDRCYAYIHYSVAWTEIKSYAYAHSEPCGLSAATLSDLAARHRKAIEAREDMCGGRRRDWEPPKTERKMFPPELRMRNSR